VQQATEWWGPSVKDRVAVITGAARGIGRAMAEALVTCEARVVATDKSWADAEEFRGQLEESGRGMALLMDVTDDDQVDDGYEAVLARFGTADVLINCAALVSETLFAPFGHVKTLDTHDRDWETMFDVNVFGALKVIRRFVRPMIDKHSGSIVSVLSSGILTTSTGGAYAGLRPASMEMPYQATKAALMAVGFYLAEEIRADGVAVNALMPGHTRASWFDSTARAYAARDLVYGGRPLVPEHVVPLTLLLAGQDGSGVTGRLFHVPDWNYDHGFGNYQFWLDRSLPPDMEDMYQRLERSNPPRAPRMRLP
jgi:NAD(P)-dependent dehydrogenase (short-subunit alcohol dehydrogenase family)